ncbi:type II toxin-antitoxin system RelE/ParE family toxin [Merismopedia glauca]|uniref:Type II toxin-antitoxin system mRNA interferase toxin, RelE/StbE family n=1 Tax=Merismopedia glauca CCAP 1448/3 TaxID=1296344 RepID=A0A2T1C8K2_9CYAN|nr:type II toxin-antitoxin system YafQ family toxin [Merismopedia glauca]PSB04600.1 type II toxin-antitoxin system mRNA interferase toxin, RelE/StbE family [Merismopedia glauca CCAP 1448/3]
MVWSSGFSRTLKRLIRQKPQLRLTIEQTIQQLAEDPFHPSLRTHKLKGELSDKWACSIDYNNRILFKFVENFDSGTEEILLLTVGSHDEVY